MLNNQIDYLASCAHGPAEERLIGEKDILHPDAERRLIHMQITLDIDDPHRRSPRHPGRRGFRPERH